MGGLCCTQVEKKVNVPLTFQERFVRDFVEGNLDTSFFCSND